MYNTFRDPNTIAERGSWPASRKLSASRVLAMLGLAMLLLSSGCAARKHSAIIVPANPKIPPLADFYAMASYHNDVAAYVSAVEPAPGTEVNLERAKYFRNKIAYNFMGEIDYVYGEYTDGLFSGKASEAFLGETATLALTTASAISLVTRTKTILSALGTGVAGVALSADKNFFAQQTFQALAIAMQARRDQARATIINNLKLGVNEYPLGAVRRDLVSYFRAGTLTGALQEIQEEAVKASANATSSPITPAGTPIGLAFSTPPTNGTVGKALADVVVQVQDAKGIVVGGASNKITISSTPAGVSGTTSVDAVGGTAIFKALVFTDKGTYTLTASSDKLTPVTSNPFTIAPAGAPFSSTQEGIVPPGPVLPRAERSIDHVH